MGFNIESVISDVEYVGFRSNPGKTGQLYMSAYFLQEDDKNINLLRLSVPSEKRQSFLDCALQRGEVCTVSVRAIAGDGYNYMQYSGLIGRGGVLPDSVTDY